jgi:hypothetical protein
MLSMMNGSYDNGKDIPGSERVASFNMQRLNLSLDQEIPLSRSVLDKFHRNQTSLYRLQMNGSFDKVKGHSRVLSVAAFNSAKKRMGVAVKANDGRVRVHWKGAAEILLEECTHWGDETGATYAMTDEKVGPSVLIIWRLFLCLSLVCVSIHQRTASFAFPSTSGVGSSVGAFISGSVVNPTRAFCWESYIEEARQTPQFLLTARKAGCSPRFSGNSSHLFIFSNGCNLTMRLQRVMLQ